MEFHTNPEKVAEIVAEIEAALKIIRDKIDGNQ